MCKCEYIAGITSDEQVGKRRNTKKSKRNARYYNTANS